MIAFPSDHSECLCGEFLGSSSSLIINWPYPHARLPHPATTLEPAPLICVPSLQKCPNPPACCRQEPGSHSALCPFFTSHTRSISEPVRSTFQILLESIPSSHPTSLSKAQLSGWLGVAWSSFIIDFPLSPFPPRIYSPYWNWETLSRWTYYF